MEECIKEEECDRPTGPCEKKTKRQRKCKEEDAQDIDMGADCAPRGRKRAIAVEPTRQSTRIKIVKEAKEAVEQHAKAAAAAKVSNAVKRVKKAAAAATTPTSMDEVEDIIKIEAEHASAIRTLYQDFGVLKGIRLDPHMTRLVDLQHPNHFRDLYGCISQRKRGQHETFVMDVIESIKFIEPATENMPQQPISTINVDIETSPNIDFLDTTIVNINNMTITLTAGDQITTICITRTSMVGDHAVVKAALIKNPFIKSQIDTLTIDSTKINQVQDGEYQGTSEDIKNKIIIVSLSSLLERDNGTELLLEIIATTIRAKQLKFAENTYNKFNASTTFNHNMITYNKDLFENQASFIHNICQSKLESFVFESLKGEVAIGSGATPDQIKQQITTTMLSFNYETLITFVNNLTNDFTVDQISELPQDSGVTIVDKANETCINTAIQLIHQAKRPLLLFDLLKSAEFNSILLYDLVNTHLVKSDSTVNVKLLFKQSSDPIIVQMNSSKPPPRKSVRTRGTKTPTIVPYTGLPIENVFKVSRTLINKLNVRGAKPFENNRVFMMPSPAVGVVRLSMKEVAILNSDSLNIMARYGITPVEKEFSVGLDFYEILSEHHSFEEFRRKFETENYYLPSERKLNETESEQFLKKMRDVIETGIALCDLSDRMSAVAIGGGKKPRAQAKNIQEKFDSVKVWIRNKVQRISETAKRITPPKRKPQPVQKQAKKKP